MLGIPIGKIQYRLVIFNQLTSQFRNELKNEKDRKRNRWAANTFFDASQAATAAQGHVQVVWGAWGAIGLVVHARIPAERS